MAGPITLKAGSYPAAADGLQGFRELTNTEIANQIAGVITSKFATDTDGTGTAELVVTTGSLSAGVTNIGSFSDRVRQESVGAHPASGAISTTTNTFGQVNTVLSENPTRPLRWNGSGVEESSDGEIDTEILDIVINAMVSEDANTVGQYKIDTSSPAGGTWTARYTITDTQTDGTTVSYYLWQKTGVTTNAGTDSNLLLKSDDFGNVTEMSVADVETLDNSFRNRIISSGVGTYLVQTGSPTDPGTWVQMGGTMTDNLKDITNVNYAGGYTGTYTGYYDRFFSGYLNGSYAGSYSGTYTGYYAGATIQSSSSTQETKQLFLRTA